MLVSPHTPFFFLIRDEVKLLMPTTIKGSVAFRNHGAGCKAFSRLVPAFPEVFLKATGVKLFPGTLNVVVNLDIEILEKFRIKGHLVNKPHEDLLFERCLANGYPAFRVRPFDLETGGGGHGDDVLEIVSAHTLPNVKPGSAVEIMFFREIPC